MSHGQGKMNSESVRPASKMDVSPSDQGATKMDSTPSCLNTVPSESRQEALSTPESAAASDDVPLPSWLYLSALNGALSLQLRPEVFRRSSSPSVPFHLRETQEALRFYDDYFPDHPIHVLRLGHDVLLRLRLTQDAASPFTIQRIVALSVKLEDEAMVELLTEQTDQTDQSDAIEAVGLLRPSNFASDGRLNAISPSFGMVDRKYVKLAMQIRVQLSAPFRAEVNLWQCIYVKIVHPQSKLRLHRWLRMFENQDQHDIHD